MKKGFTLVELLAVIILLGLLGLIIYPTVNGVINTNKQKLHDKQIEELKRYADTYALANMSELNTNGYYKNIVTFTDLYEAGIIQNDKVIDPSNDEEMTGCMALTWNEERQAFGIEYTTKCTYGYVTLSGTITGKRYKKSNGTMLDTTIRLVQGNEVLYETTVDESGDYSFDNVLEGTYLIQVFQMSTTKYGIDYFEIEGDMTKNIEATLYLGDVNGDDVINEKDKNIILDPAHYGRPFGSDGYLKELDLDGNDAINNADLSLAMNSANYKKTSIIVNDKKVNISGKVNQNSNLTKMITLTVNNKEYTVNLNSDGTFKLENIPSGTVRLYVADYKVYTETGWTNEFLASTTYEHLILNLKKDINFNVAIYPGDFGTKQTCSNPGTGRCDISGHVGISGGDGVIDAYDIDYLNTRLGKETTPQYDLNNDNVFNSSDIEIVRKNIGQKSVYIIE